jgi:hypothetical protein
MIRNRLYKYYGLIGPQKHDFSHFRTVSIDSPDQNPLMNQFVTRKCSFLKNLTAPIV